MSNKVTLIDDTYSKLTEELVFEDLPEEVTEVIKKRSWSGDKFFSISSIIRKFSTEEYSFDALNGQIMMPYEVYSEYLKEVYGPFKMYSENGLANDKYFPLFIDWPEHHNTKAFFEATILEKVKIPEKRGLFKVIEPSSLKVSAKITTRDLFSKLTEIITKSL